MEAEEEEEEEGGGGLRTPVCSPRYEIGWDHFDASMNSYTSLSLSPPPPPLSLSFSLLALSKLLLINCTFVQCALSRTCVPAIRGVFSCQILVALLAAKCDITRTVYRARMCAKRQHTKSPAVFNTLEQISIIVRYSPNRDYTA